MTTHIVHSHLIDDDGKSVEQTHEVVADSLHVTSRALVFKVGQDVIAAFLEWDYVDKEAP